MKLQSLWVLVVLAPSMAVAAPKRTPVKASAPPEISFPLTRFITPDGMLLDWTPDQSISELPLVLRVRLKIPDLPAGANKSGTFEVVVQEANGDNERNEVFRNQTSFRLAEVADWLFVVKKPGAESGSKWGAEDCTTLQIKVVAQINGKEVKDGVLVHLADCNPGD